MCRGYGLETRSSRFCSAITCLLRRSWPDCKADVKLQIQVAMHSWPLGGAHVQPLDVLFAAAASCSVQSTCMPTDLSSAKSATRVRNTYLSYGLQRRGMLLMPCRPKLPWKKVAFQPAPPHDPASNNPESAAPWQPSEMTQQAQALVLDHFQQAVTVEVPTQPEDCQQHQTWWELLGYASAR